MRETSPRPEPFDSQAMPAALPRARLERTTNLASVNDLPRGGHFAPFEVPELYAQEVRAFFRPFRAASPGGT